MAKKRTIRVFIASPSGLEFARNAFKRKIDELNLGFGDGCGVEFKAIGWEDTITPTGRRVQSEINKDIESCEVLILVLHDFLGRENSSANIRKVKKLPGLENLSPSLTMEEFSLAMSQHEKTGFPLVYPVLRNISSDRRTDPGPKLKKVLKFRTLLESSGLMLIHGWDNESQFEKQIDKLLRSAASTLSASPTSSNIGSGKVRKRSPKNPPEPNDAATQLEALQAEHMQALEELVKLKEKQNATEQAFQRQIAAHRGVAARADTAENLTEAKETKKAIGLAERAAKAALEGRVEEARQDFASALDGTTSEQVLRLGYEFFKRIGEFDEAEHILTRWLTISDSDHETADTAAAYARLGLIERTRGHQDAADKYHKKSLAIKEKLEQLEGMADDYRNLGQVEQKLGNLDVAEEHLRKSLMINEKLERLEGLATGYADLGSLAHTLCDLHTAEEYYRKSLAIHKKLGRQWGVAASYASLGSIEKDRGNLDSAVEYYKKSLFIEENLGRLLGMSAGYTNLESIELRRRNLDAAEKYCKKSLAIEKKLGRLQGMGIQYASLGSIARQRGNSALAKRHLTRSRDLFAKAGAKHLQKLAKLLLNRLK